MAAEVLGVIVDQRHKFFHQPSQRPVLREPGDNDQKAGAAPGQDLDRSDLAPTRRIPADSPPQPVAFVGAQRLQLNNPKQLEERLLPHRPAPEIG